MNYEKKFNTSIFIIHNSSFATHCPNSSLKTEREYHHPVLLQEAMGASCSACAEKWCVCRCHAWRRWGSAEAVVMLRRRAYACSDFDTDPAAAKNSERASCKIWKPFYACQLENFAETERCAITSFLNKKSRGWLDGTIVYDLGVMQPSIRYYFSRT